MTRYLLDTNAMGDLMNRRDEVHVRTRLDRLDQHLSTTRFASKERAGESNMNAIKSSVKNGRVSLDVPPDWPEGCAVIIEPLPAPAEKIGLDESEWRDDPASLADWEAWIKTLQPLEFTPDEEAAFARFNEELSRYNIEAVRRQMEEGPLP